MRGPTFSHGTITVHMPKSGQTAKMKSSRAGVNPGHKKHRLLQIFLVFLSLASDKDCCQPSSVTGILFRPSTVTVELQAQHKGRRRPEKLPNMARNKARTYQWQVQLDADVFVHRSPPLAGRSVSLDVVRLTKRQPRNHTMRPWTRRTRRTRRTP
jgi:hypothetical protein